MYLKISKTVKMLSFLLNVLKRFNEIANLAKIYRN